VTRSFLLSMPLNYFNTHADVIMPCDKTKNRPVKPKCPPKVMEESLRIMQMDVDDSHKISSMLQEQALQRHYKRIGFKP